MLGIDSHFFVKLCRSVCNTVNFFSVLRKDVNPLNNRLQLKYFTYVSLKGHIAFAIQVLSCLSLVLSMGDAGNMFDVDFLIPRIRYRLTEKYRYSSMCMSASYTYTTDFLY